jgi:hypothetical protein
LKKQTLKITIRLGKINNHQKFDSCGMLAKRTLENPWPFTLAGNCWLCPEDMTQMTVGKEMLYDRLPDDLKNRVVWRKDFWLTDMATSV